jgi:hypothetical protein
MITIEDRQGGGDSYAFDVTWKAEGEVAQAAAPFFDDVRACQDVVRQRFAGQNGRRTYIDFDSFAERQSFNNGDRERNRGGYRGRDQARVGQEKIVGRGTAKSWSESRDLTYSCLIDTQHGQVQSGDYQYSGGNVRQDQRNPLK